MKYKLVIFDWDGTVMDSIARIVASLQSAAQACQVPVPNVEEAKSIIGLSLPVAMSQLFPEYQHKHDALAAQYKDQYVNKNDIETPLFEGVESLLKKLTAQGCLLAVATGKSRKGLDRLLALTGLADYFVITQTADEAESKPSAQMLSNILAHTGISPKDAIMIGDSKLDLQMANNIDMDSIGVTFGVSHRDELAVYDPIATVDVFSQLESYL